MEILSLEEVISYLNKNKKNTFMAGLD